MGHLTVTYALREPLKKRFPSFAPLGPLLFGAILPDLLDKLTRMLLGTPGRGMAHSAVVLALLFYVIYLAFPTWRKTLYAVAAGAFLHLLEDFAQPAILLWPLLDSWPLSFHYTLFEKIYSYYFLFVWPFQLGIELISYPFCFYILAVRKNLFALKGGPAASIEP